MDIGPIPSLFSYLQLIPDGGGRKSVFSNGVSLVTKATPQGRPRSGWPIQSGLHGFCVLYFCFDFQGFLFCLQRRMNMKLQGRKLGGKRYDQNILYEKISIKRSI